MVKAKKERLKENEDAEDEKPQEEEDMEKKKPVQTYKEGEADPDFKPSMQKADEAEDQTEEETNGEPEEEDEDEEMKAKKKKKVYKTDGLAINPEESAEQSQTAEHTTTTDSVINTRQNVFVPSSGIQVARTQETPMGVVPAIKKSATADLMKSPLFISITKQMDSMQEALSNKVAALEKSVSDRLKNIKTDVEKIEKFYSGSFYKAASEEVNPEGIQAQTISKQIEAGKVRYRM